MTDREPTPLNFEAAFKRLEDILEKMNSGNITLEESLKLYSEADQLATVCTQQLNEAEQTIETLTKNRQGEIVLGKDQRPLLQPFKP